MVEINDLTHAFFEARFADSWGRDYLTDRLGVDLAGDEPSSGPGRLRPAGRTWSTTYAAAGSATTRCWPPASPPAPAPVA